MVVCHGFRLVWVFAIMSDTKKQRALDNAEKNGFDYEKLVYERLRQIEVGRVFEKWHSLCKIRMSESLEQLGLGPYQHADGYLPDTGNGTGTYVEVKSGAGVETDSIDKKWVGDLLLFPRGWYGLSNQKSLFGNPPKVLYIFAGKKEHSAYRNIFMSALNEAKESGQPWAKYVEAIRFSDINTATITSLVGPVTGDSML
jgi:hypothetical protein